MHKLAYDLILIEKCNLRGQHCFEQDHTRDWCLDDLSKIPHIVEHSFVDQYTARNKQLDQLTISLCGGELFIDGFPDSRLDIYSDIIDRLRSQIAKHYNRPIQFEMISNALFTKRERVVEFLKKTHSHISISYDPACRYASDKQKNIVLDNIRAFNELRLLDEISITLTKPSIKFYVDNDDLRQFADIDIGINYYIISNPTYKHLIPSDDDYWSFWKYCYDRRYFNVKALKQFVDNIAYDRNDQFCICDDRLIVRNNVVTYNCATYSTNFTNCDFYGNTAVNESTVRFVKKMQGQNKRQCIYCQYNDVCPGVCWASTLHKDNQVITSQCPNKRLIQLIINDSKN